MKPIPFTDGYFACEKGHIYSMRPRRRNCKPPLSPQKLNTQKTPNGYNIVKVVFMGKRKSMQVSYLVLLTFIGDRPTNKHQACHGLLGKSDDSITNLCWGTVSKNNLDDKIRDGSFMQGERHHARKLNNEAVKEIRQLHSDGWNNHQIADKYGVHHSNISCVVRGVTWRHIS